MPPRCARCSSVASLTRCASPPDNSVAGWPSRIYPSPTSRKTPSDRRRDSSSAKNSNAPSTVIASTSAIDLSRYLDLERLGVVAGALAGRARRVDARQEQQFDADEAFALTGFAASLRDVEGKPAGIVAPGARLLRRGEQLSHVIQQARVRRKIRARRAADRLLIDHDQSLDPVEPFGDLAAERLDRRFETSSSSAASLRWPSPSATASTRN